MRRFGTILLAVLGVAAVLAGGFYFAVMRPLGTLGEGLKGVLQPLGLATDRIELVEGAPDALILSPFVTGDVPRLLTGPALESRADALWYKDTVDTGNTIGTVIFGLMGMPPMTEIATAYKGGVAREQFICLTMACQSWPQDPAAPWGLAALRGLGDALGPEVRLERQSFTDHAAYLAAHAEVAADPQRWFAVPGAEVPLPGDKGMRRVGISLPAELVAVAPPQGVPEEDAARVAELQELARKVVGDSGGRIVAVSGTWPMPLWALNHGRPVTDPAAGDALRALPGLSYRRPVLELEIPAAAVEAARARFEALALPPADLSALPGALAQAYAAWGLDAACLPDCGGVDAYLPAQAAFDSAEPPFWAIDFWQLPPPG